MSADAYDGTCPRRDVGDRVNVAGAQAISDEVACGLGLEFDYGAGFAQGVQPARIVRLRPRQVVAGDERGQQYAGHDVP
ncbi:hypothetical protein [Nonomuraea sp. NPDC050786]|uniref:hypothetical protein n=1 Tax=Nonomuraea sp. NPDC050786 TaxID=3154840 RepID=UPI0033F7B19B